MTIRIQIRIRKQEQLFAGVGKDAPFHRLHLAVIYRVTIGTLKNRSVTVYTYFFPFRAAGAVFGEYADCG